METSVAGIPFKIPIYNASGARCSTFNQLKYLDNSESAVVLTKSCTLEPRDGNLGTRYWENDDISINSTGLANLGYKKYLEFSKDIKKPYFISVAGLSLKDNIQMIRDIQDTSISAIELNLSCPNIIGKSEVAYDFESLEEYLQKIFEVNDKPLGLKLPAYPNNFFITCATDILKKFPLKFVTCINSIGNCLVLNDTTPVIDPNGGHGGMGGKYILPIALAHVKKFRYHLSDNIDIVGCGGIFSGQDVYQHIVCGASAVQVGTCLMKEGVNVFARLAKELNAIMIEKGNLFSS